jgi:hypothetical protein
MICLAIIIEGIRMVWLDFFILVNLQGLSDGETEEMQETR